MGRSVTTMSALASLETSFTKQGLTDNAYNISLHISYQFLEFMDIK